MIQDNSKLKWFHAVGICGKATANVAKMFKEMGWFVTGSDIQFLPPASKIITDAKIPYVEGYSYEHLNKEFWKDKINDSDIDFDSLPEHPDLSLIVETLTRKNREFLYAQRLGLDIRPYSQILGEYLVKDNSIVVVGTAGKTTTTSLIVCLLEALNLNPSYMIGAEVKDLKESLVNTSSSWSVIEGDEYHSKELSRGAKFLEYKPKYLIITNIGYEHQDIFPTEELYIEEFKKVVNLVQKGGLIIARADDLKIDEALETAEAEVIKYKFVENNDELRPSDNCWYIKREKSSDFKIFDNKLQEIFSSPTNLIGDYNLENILASVILLTQINNSEKSFKVEEKTLYETLHKVITEFKGPKKRLEITYKDDNLIIIDDFAVAPDRVKNTLNTLSKHFNDYYKIVVFEPNSGSRIKNKEQFKSSYKNIFKNADKIIIPDLSTFDDSLASTEEITNNLQELGVNSINIEIDNLVSHLHGSLNPNQKNMIIFLSSYRLTTKMEELIRNL
jgi:UDP-N-acetylmuramate: L-alanyl-gamma-D-glutamyl-meso-diaminopimelate ligase